jgi:hypothetical protein
LAEILAAVSALGGGAGYKGEHVLFAAGDVDGLPTSVDDEPDPLDQKEFA